LLALSGGLNLNSSARNLDAQTAPAGQTQSRPQESPSVTERIKRVENGLLQPFVIKGQPSVQMELADRMKFYNTPGISIAVIDKGRIEWARGYGVRETGGRETVTPETLFQAASISKPVAAVAALWLVHQGKLDIDEEVNRKLTSWKLLENEFTSERKVSLRGLLSHSAGLTVHGFAGYAPDTPVPTLSQVLEGVKPANSKPIRVDIPSGTKYRYAGGGYVVLQQLLLDITGKQFPLFMRETVLKRIGMTRSTYEQPLPKERWSQAAVGHRSNGEKVKGNWHTYPEMAAAGLWTTPEDLARFAIEIQRSLAGKSNRVLSQKMARHMLTAQVGGWGLGFGLPGKGPSARFSHGGANEGYRCQLVAYKSTGQGAVVMTNSDRGSSLADEVLRGIAREYGWVDYLPKEKVLAQVDPKVYGSYAGHYELAPNFILTITSEDGRLMGQATGQPKLELFPESDTQFFPTAAAVEITFVKDEKGQVTHLILRQGGQDITAKKIK
ncbi:MAG: serine hydrolase, partial [Acidobacteria bacterium]|nr:serine hydrolase [Acidobacteriota bacterium]